ncbi:MAG: helix-turn-helix domain-containing protein [Cyclobacteriaceae bacterium]
MSLRYFLLLICFSVSIHLSVAGERLGFQDFEIYPDTEDLSFQELLRLERNGAIAFHEYDGLSPAVNYYWIKVDSELLKYGDYLLLSNYFERIEGYHSEDPMPFSLAGSLIEMKDRQYKKGFYRSVLSIPPEKQTIYIKLISEGGNSIASRSLSHLEVISEEELENQSDLISTVFTLLTGMEIIILIINLFLIYLKPSRTGIFYVFFILTGMLLVIFNTQVFIHQLGIPVFVGHFVEIILGAVIVVSFNQFSVYFLNAKRHSKWLHRVLTFPIYIPVLLSIWYQNGYYFPLLATVYFLVSLCFIGLLVWKAWENDPKNARTFVIANGFSIVAAIIMTLALKDIIPHHFLTTNVVFLGFIFRDTHFTINLVTRYFHLQKDAMVHEALIEKLEEDKQSLKRIEQLKTQFFNNASHELRTPLTLVLSPLEQTLKDESLSEPIKRELALSLNNGKYLLQLINEMLDLAKLDHGKLELLRQPTDVVEVVKNIKENFRSFANTRKQTLFITHSEESIMAMLDHDKFEKIMINLISNAIKYSDQQGKIFIELNPEGEDLEIRLTDEGVGIRPDDLPNIFNRYFQSGEIDQTGGTGIGLAIVKEFVELHGGTVTCTSTIGRGTTFTLRFPKVIPHDQKNIRIASTLDLDETKQTLLLVEDHMEMSGYLKEKLNEFNVVSASNGEEAWNQLQNGLVPSLILTDYMMPVMNGYEFAQKLKSEKKYKDIPIIFLSARTLSEDKVKILNLGVDDYIIKPFDLDELKARIFNALEVSEKRREQLAEGTDHFIEENESSFKLDLDRYIHENIAVASLSNATLANHFSLSERNLNRRVKSVAGKSPASYIKELRLQKARLLLETNSEMSVSEVAYTCGLDNLAHFSQSFKKRFGKLPSQYKE